jgi:hypothetical protein
MNNALRLKASSMFIPPRISVSVSLRWLRRAMTMILILSNFAITMWGNPARAATESPQKPRQTELRSIRTQLIEWLHPGAWNVDIEKDFQTASTGRGQSVTVEQVAKQICSVPAWLWVSSLRCETDLPPD